MTRALVGLASLLVACASIGDAITTREASLRVHVHGCGHAGCSGPTYEVSLFADGRVEWIGIDSVGFVGGDVETIDPDRIAPILETASLIRWDLVPANFADSPRCGSDGLRLMWTFDDGEAVATGYDDRVREQPFTAEYGPPCVAPELKPLRFLDTRVVKLLRELEYLGSADDWPSIYVPLVGDDIVERHEVRREQRERIRDFVREAWKPADHVVHLQIPAALAGQASTLRRRFARAGVPEDKLAVWVVPERLARRATARIVPERCVRARGDDDAVIDCPQRGSLGDGFAGAEREAGRFP